MEFIDVNLFFNSRLENHNMTLGGTERVEILLLATMTSFPAGHLLVMIARGGIS